MRVLLLGHPVSHSLSPQMQNAAFLAAGRTDTYEAVDVPPGKLRAFMSMLRDGLYLGANITVPHKLAAISHLDEMDVAAESVGAVNTVVVRDGRLLGYNTDIDGAWEGLLAPIEAQLQGANILVLGAGGGARAVLAALARVRGDRPRVSICGRSPDARQDARRIAGLLGLECVEVEWESRSTALLGATIVVNCTPLGLGDDDPLGGMAVGGKVVLDLAYRRGGTPLFKRAWREGAVAVQGDEMLLHQGAAAFELWTGLVAPLKVMREALAAALGA